MTPTAHPGADAFKTYTTSLGILNVLLVLAGLALFAGAILFWGASYLFNDSGNMPQVASPAVHVMLLDSFLCFVMLIWQFRVRKKLFAMTPNARTSMMALGVGWVVIAILNVSQFWFFGLIPAAIGIWWIVVFSRTSTREAFANAQLVSAAPEVIPPAI